MKLFIIIIICAVINAQNLLTYIECPIPGEEEIITEEICSEYTACEYTNGQCHMSSVSGYIVASDPVSTARGFTVNLTETSNNITLFHGNIPNIVLEVIYHQDYHVQIKLIDPENSRYEVPYSLNVPDEAGTNPLYSVSVNGVGELFQMNITRTDTGTQIFRTRGPVTFENQFLQITTELPSVYMYGIGEHFHSTLRHTFDIRKTYPIFNRDQPVTEPELNEYGSHPYYVNVEDTEGNTHGILLYSSNALEYSTFDLGDGNRPAVTMRSIGGIFDFHILLGPTPEDVNMQYAELVGNPLFPQYYSFGFHLSRYGYGSSEDYRVVRDRMRAAGIPQDVQTFDIDYMNSYRDFTYDPDNWGDFPSLIQELHDENIKVVLISDPALVADWDNYEPSQRGRDADVFIKWSDSSLVPDDQPEGASDYIVGYVWPDNKTVFPDFLKPETTDWWISEMSLFHSELDFDGLWIDMNEPSNFGTNTDRPFNYPESLPDWSLKCPSNDLDDPPYATRAATSLFSESGRISDKTICMSAAQNDGTNTYYHYDVHNLYGISEAKATAAALEALFPSIRYNLLSRSTFPGSGTYSMHWLGDNQSLWEHLQKSIIGMIEFNLFAIPMVGADICGSSGNADEELCIRWMQAGAFYPFSRNHNSIDAEDQDPARPGWDLCPDISRNVLLMRYKYLPYLYALFHRAHMGGRSVIRPLFNVFPTDISARDIGDQFFWGDGIMIAPVLENGARARPVYFPEGQWYDLEAGTLIETSAGVLEVSAPLDFIPVYVRGGSIIPWQEPSTTTTESVLNPFGLTVAIDDSNNASGEIFWDDLVEEHIMAESFMNMLEYSEGILSAIPMYDETVASGIFLETINYFGLENEPSSISVNGVTTDSYFYNSTSNILVLSLSVEINSSFTVVIT